MKRNLHFLFQVPAGAMEESSREDDDSNVQGEIKRNITNIMFMLFLFFSLFFSRGGGVEAGGGLNSVFIPHPLRA